MATSTNHELSFGGVSLNTPTDAVRELLAGYRFNEQFPFVFRPPSGEYAAAFASRQIALANFPDDPPMQVGRFFYPTHASRWSWYIGTCSQTQLTAIQAQLGSSKQMTPLTFNMRSDDQTHPDNSGGVSTPMLMLPPKPLGVTNSILPREPLYLVVLVDERYLWQFRPAGVIGTTALTTWSTFLSALQTALGVSISHDAFESVYLSPEPDSDLYSNYESSALLLDALAWNTGRTLVRAFDGTYSLQPIGGSLADTNSNRPGKPRYRAFGGDIYDPQETGNVQPWINAALPAKVTVTFPKYNNSTGYFIDPNRPAFFVKDSYGEIYAIDCPLSGLGDPYDTYTGITGVAKVIEDTCQALFATDGASTPTNLTELTSLAQQLAKNYYDYQIAALDEAYNGIRDWAPDPLNDLIFDYHPPKLIQTRVMRKPWDFQTWQMQHHTSSAIPGSDVFTGNVVYTGKVTFSTFGITLVDSGSPPPAPPTGGLTIYEIGGTLYTINPTGGFAPVGGTSIHPWDALYSVASSPAVWHVAGQHFIPGALSGGTITGLQPNWYYAAPILSYRGATIHRVAFGSDGAGATLINVRMGLYNSVSCPGNLLPNVLIYDFGSLLCPVVGPTTNVFTPASPITLVPGMMYWLVMQIDNGPTNIIWQVDNAKCVPVLGFTPGVNVPPGVGWIASPGTFGAMPAVFGNPPTGGFTVVHSSDNSIPGAGLALPALFFDAGG